MCEVPCAVLLMPRAAVLSVSFALLLTSNKTFC